MPCFENSCSVALNSDRPLNLVMHENSGKDGGLLFKGSSLCPLLFQPPLQLDCLVNVEQEDAGVWFLDEVTPQNETVWTDWFLHGCLRMGKLCSPLSLRLLTMDASLVGWVGVLDSLSVPGTWSAGMNVAHKILELRANHFTLLYWLAQLWVPPNPEGFVQLHQAVQEKVDLI